MSMLKPKPPRVHWDAETGWVIDTNFSLSFGMLKSCVEYTRKVQTDRLRTMPLGDRRDQMELAPPQLSALTIRINLLPKSDIEPERVLFGR